MDVCLGWYKCLTILQRTYIAGNDASKQEFENKPRQMPLRVEVGVWPINHKMKMILLWFCDFLAIKHLLDSIGLFCR